MNVLVTCHGNRFRSPFAAGLIKQLRPELAVRSSGVKIPIGTHPAAASAREAAERRGFSLMDHRARATTAELIDWADMVLYMDRGNLRRLLAQFPGLEKQRCLASYLGRSRIPDPAFIPNHRKEPVWVLLEAACKAFVKTI